MANTEIGDIELGFEYNNWILFEKIESVSSASFGIPTTFFTLVFKEKNGQNKIRFSGKESFDKIKNLPFPKKTVQNNKGREIECFEASMIDGKYFCPECNSKEGGTSRIITHTWNCSNKGKEYCQRLQKGGKKKTMKRKNKKHSKKSRRVRK